MDTMHADKLEKDEVLSVDINYLSEVRFGEKMMMYIHQDDIGKSVQVDGIESVTGRYAFCCKMHKTVGKEI
jgi:acyl-ACP thioesterase